MRIFLSALPLLMIIVIAPTKLLPLVVMVTSIEQTLILPLPLPLPYPYPYPYPVPIPPHPTSNPSQVGEKTKHRILGTAPSSCWEI